MKTRKQLKKAIEKKFPDVWFKDSEEWDADMTGGLWTGEGSYDNDGIEVFDYWNQDYSETLYVMNVLKSFRKLVESYGYWIECQDAGTFFILPDC